MSLSSPTTVLGVFDDPAAAADAIEELHRAGFSDNNIGFASREWTKDLDVIDPNTQHIADEGAVKGTIIGGGVGAALGLVGAILVPGAIPIAAGGVIAGILLGAAAGAAGGAFAGPFIALGYSEEAAAEHAAHVNEGKTVVIVYAPDRRDEAHDILVKAGAYDESMSSSP